MPVPAQAGISKEGETRANAPSSLEEGVGGGGVSAETLKARAREMRNNPTEPEQRFWQALKSKQLEGFKFRRQPVIGRRIVDFFCPAAKLAVEIDGETHDPTTDQKRDERLLRETGNRVIRFRNEDVMRNLDGVLTERSVALARQTTPCPPRYS